MQIAFTKMHGLGNDFMLFDAPADGRLPTVTQWRALADRYRGIGFDQAVVFGPPRTPGAVASYRIFNADGGEAEQSGNGARCAVMLLYQRGLARGTELKVDTGAGLLIGRVLEDGIVSVNMGAPAFEPPSLPFDVPAQATTYQLQVGDEQVEFGAVSMGNPHAVLRVAAIESAPVERIGKLLQASARFPRQVNVGFMQIVDAGHIRLRVYERGAGETLACGTGACAAVAVGRSLGLLGAEVEVHVPGGKLGVHWDGPGQPVWLTGPAIVAFQGHARI